MRERLLIAWIGPRGIVCAAVVAIFALRLEQEGVPGANLLVPLAFLVIIGTVVLQSLTAKPIAAWLKVRDPAPAGYLIIGGGRVARMIAQTLAPQDVRVTKTTGLTEEFGLQQYLENYQDRALVLFAIDTSDRLRLVTDQEDRQPEAGWQVARRSESS